MYSRLEHHDKQVILKQTAMFLGGTVLLSAAFLFLILPAFIRFLAFRTLGSKIVVEETDTLPSRPFLSSPFDATSSAQITLTGSAQAKQKIILLIGGVPGPETTAGDNGSFSFSQVGLESGGNTFVAVSENDKGTRSNPSNTVTISYVKDAPKLEISTPATDTTITQRKQNPATVAGKTDSGNKVYINDRLQFVGSDGSFSGKVQLSDGDNTIVVKAVNPAQVETTQEISVHFQP
jgi:hypothetical protein